jgi:hypothetical protein
MTQVCCLTHPWLDMTQGCCWTSEWSVRLPWRRRTAERVRFHEGAQRALCEHHVARRKAAQRKEAATFGARDAPHDQRAAIASALAVARMRTERIDVDAGAVGGGDERAAKCEIPGPTKEFQSPRTAKCKQCCGT